MTNLNQWIGEGNIGSDPELRHTHGTNKPVTNFFLYVDDLHKKVNSSGSFTYKKTTNKVPVVAWDGKATYITNNHSRGDKVRIVGKLKTRLVEKQDGTYISSFEIIVENISMIKPA